ncbi:MAG TPA: ABC transporter permease [Thermoanaerobaculia bacterium]|jgi:putative ABC transport system permease protein|nr:ABC transporter permease [Thermoanaerobaculia bacterium]
MLGYHVQTALRSLRRTPILTVVLIAAIALGICVSTTFIALRHVFEKDPLPGKSQSLYYVRLDNWDPARAYVAEDPKSLPPQITYKDMRALMRSTIPTRQTGTFVARMFVFPPTAKVRPFREGVRLAFSDFFTMFNIPFQYGSGWDKAADAKPEQVIVIDAAMNQKLFGGGNSVGKTVRIADRNFKVAGVISPDWQPSYRFYDIVGGPQPVESIFMPFNLTPVMQIQTNGNSDGWQDYGNSQEDFLNSEQTWIQFWVELPDDAKAQAYRDYVTNYVRDEKTHGRFQRPLHVEINSMPDLLVQFGFVPKTVKAMTFVSLLFLIVCSLNLVGLLLGKFLARVPEISVRRALGASKAQVFWQHVVECEVIGVIGGALGMLLSVGLLSVIAKVLQQRNGNSISGVSLDLEMVAVSVFLSLVAGLMAGVYPAWRICSVAPAMQLKLQ